MSDQDPFDTLRTRTPTGDDADPVAHRFLAVAEIERFLPLRRRVGYAAANALMTTLSERIVAAIGDASIGRIGRTSIEFVFTAPDRGIAAVVLERAVSALAEPIVVAGFDLVLPSTIGAVDLGTGELYDEAVDIAAAAVLDAQQVHRTVIIVDPVLPTVAAVDDLTLLGDMARAMENGALQVHYQPKLRARTNTIEAAEGLLRWDHPLIGKVPIEPLIRLAEETGAIRRLSEWVIARAVLDRGTLEADGHDITIWVNLSGVLLPDAAFTARALELVAGSGGKIGFEITETAVIGDPERALANLAAFRAAGIRIAIDDYGSGLSSLAYLKQLPAQELKIDRLFIKELVSSHRDPLLVRSSIDLAHALEMEVTAEGVDDPVALALLRIMGCDLIQGYLIAPALPILEFRRLLSDRVHLDALAAPAVPSGWQTGPAVNRG